MNVPQFLLDLYDILRTLMSMNTITENSLENEPFLNITVWMVSK